MFSERLKNTRNDKGFTQKSMSDSLEITPNAYRKYEYGEREPSFELLVKICRLLEVSSDYLIGLKD